MTTGPAPALTRRRDCFVAGVAGGLASHLGWPVTAVRAVFVATAFLGGAGALLYAWLWAFTPWSDATGPDDRVRRRAPVAVLLTIAAVGAALAAIAGSAVVPWLVDGRDVADWAPWSLVAAVAAVGAGWWVSFVDRPDPERGRRQEVVVRTALTVALGVLVVVLVTAPTARAFPVATLAISLGVLIAIGLVYAPALVRVWRDLNDERVRRIRDEQRSAMAAHLHDSVLQTLALIQNRAGASSEAGRLARAQERELRSWLFDGDAPADSDLATDLRDYAAALELDYAVRIEVVAVGTSTERASGELAAAAREAMLNAARHAGGEVSVYIEGSPDGVDVYVRDRGPGFDPAAVPADRLGVRESIIGRMRRAGGRASVRAGTAGVGTEVHLRFEMEGSRV